MPKCFRWKLGVIFAKYICFWSFEVLWSSPFVVSYIRIPVLTGFIPKFFDLVSKNEEWFEYFLKLQQKLLEERICRWKEGSGAQIRFGFLFSLGTSHNLFGCTFIGSSAKVWFILIQHNSNSLMCRVQCRKATQISRPPDIYDLGTLYIRPAKNVSGISLALKMSQTVKLCTYLL